METLITILIYAGIVQGFYMALLLNHNKRRNTANQYLAVLLVIMSLSIAHTEFVIPEIHKTLNDPFRIKEPFLMLVIPLIWLYVKKLAQPSFRFSFHTSIHFLPYIVFMSVSIPAFLHGSESVVAQFLVNHSFIFNSTIWAVLCMQYSVYLLQIVKITRDYKVKAEQELSNIEQVDISWLNTFLVAFIVVFVLLAIMFAGAIHNFDTEWLSKVVSIVFSVTIFVLGFKGLFQQSIFSNTISEEVSEFIVPEISKGKPVNEQLKTSLLEFMEKNKPFREPELTLTSLAKQMNLSRNQLSEIINCSIGCNFYDFVNKYRVEDVKQRLSVPANKDYTLLAIAFDAGFPSKSTFNSIFKKFTGLTPSAYRTGLL